jgi:hypothetical protein
MEHVSDRRILEERRLKRLTHIIGQNGTFGILRLGLGLTLRDQMEPSLLSSKGAWPFLPEGREFPIGAGDFSFTLEQKCQRLLLVSVQIRANFLS